MPYHTTPQCTTPSHPVPHHTTPYHTSPHHTIPSHLISSRAVPVPYHIPYNSIPYNTITYHTTPHHTIPYHTIPYHTIPYHTIPYHTIPCREGSPGKEMATPPPPCLVVLIVWKGERITIGRWRPFWEGVSSGWANSRPPILNRPLFSYRMVRHTAVVTRLLKTTSARWRMAHWSPLGITAPAKLSSSTRWSPLGEMRRNESSELDCRVLSDLPIPHTAHIFDFCDWYAAVPSVVFQTSEIKPCHVCWWSWLPLW